MDFEITNQMLNPKIKIVSSSKLVEFNLQTIQDYIEIGGRVEPSSKYYLLNYQFSESVNNFSGSFSVTIYEDIDTDSKECIFSRVKNLDVVFIYENSESQDFKLEKNNPVFIGVVHSKNIRTMMNNGKVSRTTTLSGNSICSLIGDLSVSLDIHSLTGVEAVKVQKDFTEEIKSKKTYEDVVLSLWKNFLKISEQVASGTGTNTASVFIDKLLGSFYVLKGSEKFFRFEKMSLLEYPVVANFWTQSVNSFSDMLRTLLPSNIFEIFGNVDKTGTPYLLFREMPFSANDWKDLPITEIDPLYLIGYDISQSDNEVYNAFLAYIEGSSQDQALSLTLAAIENRIAKDTEKMSKYGYRPLQVNFRGYNTSQDILEDKDPKKAIKECSDKLKEWYGALDELYSGTLNLVRGSGDKIPKVGERIKFINYEFYVTDKTHSWSYGGPVNVTLNVSRGAFYNKLGKRDTNSPESKEKFGCRYAELKKYIY